MALLEKLDDLLTKLDNQEETSNLSSIENNSQDDIIEPEAEIVDAGTQDESPEDVKPDETIEKLSNIVLKQNEQIENLHKQIAQLVNEKGAQLNDGQAQEVTHMPSAEPETYVSLKELDFNM